MALVTCAECGHRMSDKADKCPSCGAPPARPGIPLRLIAGGFIVAGVVLTYAIGLSGDSIPVVGPVLVAIGIVALVVSWFKR